MAKRRQRLVDNEIYHIIIRGVGDSVIFKNDRDRYRAIFSFYEFNNDRPIEMRTKIKNRLSRKKNGGWSSVSRDMLVDVLTFCLMPNHTHLLLRQKKIDGITKFMRKLGTGYASYFNKKYKRKGYLFQGRFQSVHIKTDQQLRIIFCYIHTNPISLVEPLWKEKGIKNYKKIKEFIENYKWSSYPDYLGKYNFPSVTRRNFLLGVIGGKDKGKEFIDDWIKHKQDLRNYNDILLDS